MLFDVKRKIRALKTKPSWEGIAQLQRELLWEHRRLTSCLHHVNSANAMAYESCDDLGLSKNEDFRAAMISATDQVLEAISTLDDFTRELPFDALDPVVNERGDRASDIEAMRQANGGAKPVEAQ